ncbi:MAG TPA: hypothetical protein VFD84_02740 [Candidatus Binatia bacterium]|jgi:hypothetical protein|nr:hypothetical protein [Candidatus Binatia bacterium]
MPVRVHLQFVKPGMRLASPIFDPDGKLVAGAGTQLGSRVVRVLRTMAVQSVLVADGEALQSWETIRPLEEELAALDERFGPDVRNAALRELRDAIARHLAKRAARLADDPGVAPAPAKP